VTKTATPALDQVSIAHRYKFSPVTITVPASARRRQYDLTITDATITVGHPHLGPDHVAIDVAGAPAGTKPSLRHQRLIRFSTAGGNPILLGDDLPLDTAPDFLLAAL